jgi:hypothetical protein
VMGEPRGDRTAHEDALQGTERGGFGHEGSGSAQVSAVAPDVPKDSDCGIKKV